MPSINADFIGDANAGDIADARTVPTLHRAIAESLAGLGSFKIRNTGVGGATVSTLAAQITVMSGLASNFDTIFLQIGLNEVIATNGDFDTDFPT